MVWTLPWRTDVVFPGKITFKIVGFWGKVWVEYRLGKLKETVSSKFNIFQSFRSPKFLLHDSNLTKKGHVWKGNLDLWVNINLNWWKQRRNLHGNRECLFQYWWRISFSREVLFKSFGTEKEWKSLLKFALDWKIDIQKKRESWWIL